VVELSEDVVAGQAIYNRITLAAYDVGVLSLSCRLVWRCPKAEMLASYNRNVGRRHLEVGVGTAFFLDKCRFPDPRPRVTLVDLNPTVLRVAAGRISRYQPRVIRANALPAGHTVSDRAAAFTALSRRSPAARRGAPSRSAPLWP
jgi:ubiquinone/menaquinone biosynthesis C-methylase UbiE